MRILVCVKRVPAPGERIVLTPDQREIDAALLGFAISPHEECAVEEAVRIVEREGGTVTVMTLGPPEAVEQLRAAVAVGATEGVLLQTEQADWDPVSTAGALACAISGLEAEAGEPYDLLLFGAESADAGGYQVGIRAARMLGRPIVSGIKGLDIADGWATARRETATGWEAYRLPLPAAAAVKEGINLPRYPTLKGRMAARKAEVTIKEVEPAGSGQSKIRLETPPAAGGSVTILGEGPAAAPAVADILEELGLL